MLTCTTEAWQASCRGGDQAGPLQLLQGLLHLNHGLHVLWVQHLPQGFRITHHLPDRTKNTHPFLTGPLPDAI